MDRIFTRALSLVLKWEGGFANHPSDPGGPTNKGITLATFRRYVDRKATVDDLKRLTVEQAGKVYRKQYWDAVRGDDLPDGIDYAVFDFAVNSGPVRARKYLQAAAGVAQDGIIGPETLAAVRGADPVTLIESLCASRMAFLKRLKTWPTFGKGWTNRVNDVRLHAVDMTGAPQEPAKEAQTPAPAPVPHETAERAPTGGLGPALAERYRNEPRVIVHKQPGEFFLYEFGQVMIASHHGDKAKPDRLVHFVADEFAEAWGRTKHRFLFTGHLHHHKSQDIGGMRWEQLRAVTERDAYAVSHAYTARAQLQAITYHRTRGEIQRVAVNA